MFGQHLRCSCHFDGVSCESLCLEGPCLAVVLGRHPLAVQIWAVLAQPATLPSSLAEVGSTLPSSFAYGEEA